MQYYKFYILYSLYTVNINFYDCYIIAMNYA